MTCFWMISQRHSKVKEEHHENGNDHVGHRSLCLNSWFSVPNESGNFLGKNVSRSSFQSFLFHLNGQTSDSPVVENLMLTFCLWWISRGFLS